MAAPSEVLLTTESTGEQWNVCAWNPVSGAALMTFKGSNSAPRTLDLVSDEFLLAGDSAKPLINVWNICRQDHAQTRIVCAGKVTALAVSRDGAYCVAGIGDKLYVWQTSTGNLMVVLSGHYLKITCVRFTDDGSHFVSGSEDSLVLVWSLSRVLARGASHGSAGIEPLHHWSAHASAITDIHVGLGAASARVATASRDKSVKVWQLASGQLIETFLHPYPVTAVVMDHAESRLYAGAADGNIYITDFAHQRSRTLSSLVNGDEGNASGRLVLKGHRSVVTCLSLSMSCETLASGSADGTVMLWSTYSHECVETIKHKGQVTNCLLIPTPANLLEPDNRGSGVPFTAFKRQTQDSLGSDGQQKERETISVRIHGKSHYDDSAQDRSVADEAEDILQTKRSRSEEEAEQVVVQEELSRVRRANQQLYQFAVDKIIGSL